VAERIGPRPSAFEAFKTLRNRLRLLRIGEVVGACLRTLNDPKAQKWERLRYYRPWEILLLFKWTVLHGEWRDSLTRSMRGQDEFNHLVNLTAEVFNCGRLPSHYDALPLFMRNMAYQQFWLQGGVQGGGLSRQSFIFAGLPENHGFRRVFRERLRVDIPDFVEMSLMLLPKIFLTEEPAAFTRDWFAPVASSLPAGAVDAFLAALSVDVHGARDLAASKRTTDINWELFERTPFQARPLLRVDRHYVPLSKVLLARTLELFVYRFLRDLDAAQFMQTFGPMFERYVHRLLDYAGTPYWNEAQLMAACPGKKVVDALITAGEDNILLDAKGIEFPEIGMITHLPDIVRDRAKPSILKAIDQAYSTVAALQTEGGKGLRLGAGKNYLLVVTMQDTFLGNGSDFFRMVGTNELTRIQQRYGDTAYIPADHMYFVAVQDVEVLCCLVKDGATTFADALHNAREDDSVGQTKKFVFHQHLASHYKEPEMIPFLKEEIDRVFARCEAAFKQK
jgi:hypothetical protein